MRLTHLSKEDPNAKYDFLSTPIVVVLLRPLSNRATSVLVYEITSNDLVPVLRYFAPTLLARSTPYLH